jgi:hypothetical protein
VEILFLFSLKRKRLQRIAGLAPKKATFAAQTALSSPIYWGRKVRTPEGSIAGNARRVEQSIKDKCNRKQVQVML